MRAWEAGSTEARPAEAAAFMAAVAAAFMAAVAAVAMAAVAAGIGSG
jgi:hypothetical protein